MIDEKLTQKYHKRLKFNLELMIEHATDAFYDSYSPKMYSRQEGLYKGAKAIVEWDDWSIDIGPEHMETSYDAGVDYVFWNSFQNGFHGGAVDGPDHPEPGTPWWRAHGIWSRPAAQGPSIEEGILNQDPSSYIAEQKQMYSDEARRNAEPCVQEYMQVLTNFILSVASIKLGR